MSPRTEESNQRIREEQRERILEAARMIFAHKGFVTVAKLMYLCYVIYRYL